MARVPFLATQVPGLVGHAQRVSARRREQGPRLPGWEWTYEVFLSLFREQFSDALLPPEAIRARFDAIGMLSPELPLVDIRSVDAHGVRCVVFSSKRPVEGPPRWIFYLHGGAFVFGSPRSHAPLLARLARTTGARVLAVDYRLAPEHPFPAALDDAVTAWQWLLAQGVQPKHVTIAGDSAGGGLALTTMLALRDQGRQLPGRAVLLSPWTDLALTHEPLVRPHDYLPDPEHLETFAARYYGEVDPRDPRISPLFAEDLTGLPPILTLAGGEEMILADATRMHDRLREAKVASTLHIEPHEIHVYPMFASISRRGRDGIDRMVRFMA